MAPGGPTARTWHDVGSSVTDTLTVNKPTAADNFTSVTQIATGTVTPAAGTEFSSSLCPRTLQAPNAPARNGAARCRPAPNRGKSVLDRPELRAKGFLPLVTTRFNHCVAM